MAKEANAYKILNREEINDFYDNNINKKKIALSGGEKQRLCIARTFLKNPVILLLDEATSALDKDSEIEVQKSLDKLSINKTTVSIAHRLNTIENYDKIYVFDNGRIHEQGTHDELMKLQKRYYTLYKYSNPS
jgi:ABC-type multidrug transport system fused ATPase/permease subunit